MTKKKKICMIIATFAIIITALNMMLNPLLMSNGRIRTNILKLTPIGSSMEEVLVAIQEKNNWRIMTRSNERGYVDFRSPPGSGRVGEKHITAQIGRSGFLWYVRASWGFDEDGILIDVYVDKGSAN